MSECTGTGIWGLILYCTHACTVRYHIPCMYIYIPVKTYVVHGKLSIVISVYVYCKCCAAMKCKTSPGIFISHTHNHTSHQ